MAEDIDRITSECSICQKFKYKQQKENLKVTYDQIGPWERIGSDLFELGNKDYLLVIDYHSNFPEVVKLSSTSSPSVIRHLKSIFSRHGIPKIVVTDNGPQYASFEFREFAGHYGFKHITSSPVYPQSNGKSEKGVQIVKRLLKKAIESGQDPELALLQYRSAPLKCGKSPAELLFNRQLKTRVPRVNKTEQDSQLGENMKSLKVQQKAQYDKSAKDLVPLVSGDVVRLRFPPNSKEWNIKAKIVREVAPRSYEIVTEQGKVYRRNRRHLLKTKELYVQEQTGLSDESYASIFNQVDKLSTNSLPAVVDSQVQETAQVVPGLLSSSPQSTSSPQITRRSARISKPPTRLIEQM
ncbi:uncharacterized protein K02A2.6-like [Lineus longissimus]